MTKWQKSEVDPRDPPPPPPPPPPSRTDPLVRVTLKAVTKIDEWQRSMNGRRRNVTHTIFVLQFLYSTEDGGRQCIGNVSDSKSNFFLEMCQVSTVKQRALSVCDAISRSPLEARWHRDCCVAAQGRAEARTWPAGSVGREGASSTHTKRLPTDAAAVSGEWRYARHCPTQCHEHRKANSAHASMSDGRGSFVMR